MAAPRLLIRLTAWFPAAVLGVVLVLVGAFLGSTMNALVRFLSSGIHPFEIAFFRNAFAFIILLPMLMQAGFLTLKTERLGLHALRGVLNVLAMLSFFYALAITPLANVAALGFTAPLFATLFAALFMGERVGPRRIAALVTGFLGALVIIRPGIEGVGLGEFLVLLSSLFWSVALTVIKRLSRTESSLAITVYAVCFLTPSTLIVAVPVWVTPDTFSLFLLAGVAITGSLYQLCIAQAFKLADISQVLPADFTKIVWSAILGWMLFAELPDLWTIVGGAMIVGAVSYVTLRERHLARIAAVTEADKDGGDAGSRPARP